MRMRLTETAGLTVKNRTSSSPTSVFTRGNGNRAGRWSVKLNTRGQFQCPSRCDVSVIQMPLE